MAEEEFEREAQESFLKLLMFDLMVAQERFAAGKSQSGMRDIVRCVFAAIEGVLWTYREHIVSTAKQVDAITLAEEVALSETTYQVTSNGEINEQPRFLPIRSAIRLTTRIAKKINSNLEVDFGTSGWEHLRQAIIIRNRITHPKKRTDMSIGEDEVTTCVSALFWLLETAGDGMAAANAAFAMHTAGMREIFESLERGDTTTWAAYRAALLSSED